MRLFSLFIIVCIAITPLSAQGEFSGGFKAGLNFSNIDGPLENDNESFSINTGFHIGATVMYSFTDAIGLKGELMYSQKGTQYSYKGDSYFTFYTSGSNAGVPIYATGERSMDVSISNTYLDLPVMIYARVGKFELEAGVNAAVLIGSKASGGIKFSGTSFAGTRIDEFTTAVDYSYFSKDRGLGALINKEDVTINTLGAYLPTNINAYYEAADNKEKKYNILDLGLNVGIAFFVNKGLYIGVRGNLGLTDITNEAQDLSLESLSQTNTYITRNDEDKNISLQTSVGFRF